MDTGRRSFATWIESNPLDIWGHAGTKFKTDSAAVGEERCELWSNDLKNREQQTAQAGSGRTGGGRP